MKNYEITELLELLPDELDFDLIIRDYNIPDDDEDPIPPEEDVFTRLVEIVEEESFKKIAYFNKQNLPVMETAEPGWRTQAGERYLVHVDFIKGDGGTRWLQVYKGPAGGSDEQKARGYYINKAKAKYVEG